MAIQAQAATHKVMINNVNTTAGNTTSGYIDCLGADYCTVHVALAAITTAGTASADGVTVKILDSVDTNVSNAAAISTIANVTGKKNGGEGLYHIPVGTGRARYIFCRIVPGTSGVSNEPVTATVIGSVSRKEKGPASTSDMVTTGTNDWVTIG